MRTRWELTELIVQHDCRNNVEFVLTGNNMEFKVVEDIEADEQLFTHYGACFRFACLPSEPYEA